MTEHNGDGRLPILNSLLIIKWLANNIIQFKISQPLHIQTKIEYVNDSRFDKYIQQSNYRKLEIVTYFLVLISFWSMKKYEFYLRQSF